MGHDDQFNRPRLQGQEAEIRLDLIDRQGRKKTRTSKYFPGPADGQDGDERLVRARGRLYQCRKIDGRWHTVILSKTKAIAQSAADASSDVARLEKSMPGSIAEALMNIDGGEPDSVYGGISGLDGGEV